MRVRFDKVVALAIGLIVGCSLLAYFVKPKAPLLELVNPRQEMPNYAAHYPGDENLSNRIMKSYALAMILVQSPYIQTNLSALESVRSWAREEFQQHPDFLHPVSLPVPKENNDTVFGALGYNLFGCVNYFLEEQVGNVLSLRIAAFHNTEAYQSFRAAYFDTFGVDADAAALLAKYQSECAKKAVNVVLWTAIWLGFIVTSVVFFVRERRTEGFETLRRITASVWTMLAFTYFMQAWNSGHAASIISTALAGFISFYLFRPFVIASHEEAPRQLVFIHLAHKWIAVATWATVSCLFIQVLTWIRTGLPGTPDPITQLLACATGNFLHDPVQGKKVITGFIAVTWLLLSGWTVMQRNRNEAFGDELEDSEIETLKAPASFERLF